MAIEKVGGNVIFQKKVIDVLKNNPKENTLNQGKQSPLKEIEAENKGTTINTKA